jgi:hypothetical protein
MIAPVALSLACGDAAAILSQTVAVHQWGIAEAIAI